MKVFLDECIDWRLSRHIIGHEVRTAQQMGWTGVKNGKLLALVEKEFEVFVTVDRNLAFQQDLPAFGVAVLILRAKSNRLAELQRLIPRLLDAIPIVKPGTVTYIEV